MAHVFNAAAAFDIALFDATPEQLQAIYEDMAAEGLIPPGVPESDEADFRTSGGDLLDNDPNHRADLQEPRCLPLSVAMSLQES